MARINARTPVIALPYSERHKAVPKELLIDYETGNIYVVSADDKSVIFDITSKIFEQIENMSGDNIEITIEGIGTVKLTEIIKQLQLDIANSVQVIETGEDMHYVGRENVLDSKSVDVVNRNIEIKGFSEAEPLMIPRKGTNGKIEWVNMPMVPDHGQSGNGDIIPPGDPDDGQITDVFLIEPVNDRLYLRPTRRQKSINIDKNCIVILPRILDTFSEIEWYFVTNNFAPMLRFTNNVTWANVTDTQPKPNSQHVYKFKSWDAGENWVAELVHYNKSANEVTVDVKYLEENYFDKDHIGANYYIKPEVDQKIKGINTIDPSNYLNKTEMEEKYYDKRQVDTIVEHIPGSDLSGYVTQTELAKNHYTKPEVDTKIDGISIFDPDQYYDRTTIEANYDNKSQVADLIKGVENKIPDVSEFVLSTDLVKNHYTKPEVDQKIADIPEPDLSGYVTDTELATNHYTKPEVDAKISEIVPPEQDLTGYVKQIDLEDGYYNKTEVEDRISSINAVDPVNYYNKTEMDEKYLDKTKIESNYYDKNTIDSQHYNKTEVDDKISWTIGSVQSKLPTK